MNKNEKKIDKLDKSVSRRTFLKTAAAGAAVAAVGFPAIVRSAQDLKIVMKIYIYTMEIWKTYHH